MENYKYACLWAITISTALIILMMWLAYTTAKKPIAPAIQEAKAALSLLSSVKSWLSWIFAAAFLLLSLIFRRVVSPLAVLVSAGSIVIALASVCGGNPLLEVIPKVSCILLEILKTANDSYSTTTSKYCM